MPLPLIHLNCDKLLYIICLSHSCKQSPLKYTTVSHNSIKPVLIWAKYTLTTCTHYLITDIPQINHCLNMNPCTCTCTCIHLYMYMYTPVYGQWCLPTCTWGVYWLVLCFTAVLKRFSGFSYRSKLTHRVEIPVSLDFTEFTSTETGKPYTNTQTLMYNTI